MHMEKDPVLQLLLLTAICPPTRLSPPVTVTSCKTRGARVFVSAAAGDVREVVSSSPGGGQQEAVPGMHHIPHQCIRIGRHRRGGHAALTGWPLQAFLGSGLH